jgi:hypothetical protein
MRLALVTAVLVAGLVAGQAGAATTSPATQLRITFWTDGRPGPSQTWTLTCRPTGGVHPARVRACARLAALPQPFRPVPKEMMCIQIYGGPQEALVTGRHAGQRVWARFNLSDGCQIARWNRLVPFLPGRDA